MRPHHRTLDRQQVHRSTTKHLQNHVPLRDYKRKISVPPLWAVLLFAATGVTSILATCGRLDDLASEETICKALYACMPDFAELQRQLNRALAGRIPKASRRLPRRLAIDLTLIPYHGEPFRDPAARQDKGERQPDGVPDDGVQTDGECIKEVEGVEWIVVDQRNDRRCRLRGRPQANPSRLTPSIHEI